VVRKTPKQNTLSPQLQKLYDEEGWFTQLGEEGELEVVASDGNGYGIKHPYLIHLQIYATTQDTTKRIESFKKVVKYLWPHYVRSWHHWLDSVIEAHCSGYKQIVLAGGAACGKSFDVALVALVWYLSNPRNNAAVISSTTLDSLETRIWGYVVKLFNEAVLPLPVEYLRSRPPKIMSKKLPDKIHGLFAVAIRQGEENNVLSTLIGRHPNKGIMIVLDEATDMNASILGALPNLEQGVEFCQVWAIGNSSSKHDLHGAMATPKLGWDSIDPMKDFIWETNRRGGVCVYFNPYDSPAILDPDPVKRAILSKFLITQEGIAEKADSYGESSTAFWRFVMGFWPRGTGDGVLVSEQFLTEVNATAITEWSGLQKLVVVGGLDPEIKADSSGCILRFAILGQEISGRIVLDFRGEELIFRIKIENRDDISSEMQLATQVAQLLKQYNCKLQDLAIDCTGLGRGLGELIRMVYGSIDHPLRVISVRETAARRGVLGAGAASARALPVSSSELWLDMREYIQKQSVRGLDTKTINQLTSRFVFVKNNKFVLETKKDFVTRMRVIDPRIAHSPDEADAAALCIQIAKMNYGWYPGELRAIAGVENDTFMSQKLFAIMRERDQLKQQLESQAAGGGRPRIGYTGTGRLGQLESFARNGAGKLRH
jgi:hypothetical protein